MPTSGYSETALATKLGIKAGMTVALIHEPEGFRTLLEPLPEPLTFRDSVRGRADTVIAFFVQRAPLRRRLPALVKAIYPQGGLWLAWPKKSSSIETDLSGSQIRGLGLAAGVVDVKVCAIDDDWSGHRFVYRTKDRR